MLNEYTIVRINKTDPEIPIPLGTTGTVLIVHFSDPAAYEVEFVDDAGKSLGTYTVEEANLDEIKE